jgi:hypothetical protein
MSKMDNLRAMREARYAQAEARAKAATSAKAPKAPSSRATAAKTPATPSVIPEPAVGAEPALCGHRNISGRTCTREAGHAAKSHRYA